MPSLRLNNLNGELIAWAREDAGFSVAEVAGSCGINEETLKKIESNTLKPTQVQAEKLAMKFSRPVALFYLKEIPRLAKRQRPDNRSPQLATEFSPEVLLAIRKLNLLQDKMVELSQLLNLSSPNIPAFNITDEPKQVANSLRKYLDIEDVPRVLHRDTALDLFISKVEEKGIVVSQQRMPRSELQGASSFTPYPAIVVNQTDYKSSKIFTLMHELCHLTLRSGGYCLFETNPSKRIERFCNAVAGELLVPLDELQRQLADSYPASDEALQRLSDYFSVSRQVILLRLIHNEYVSPDLWDQKIAQWRKEYINSLGNNARRAGPVTQAIRENGHKLTRLIFNGVERGDISLSQASRYLNVRSGILEDIHRRV